MLEADSEFILRSHQSVIRRSQGGRRRVGTLLLRRLGPTKDRKCLIPPRSGLDLFGSSRMTTSDKGRGNPPSPFIFCTLYFVLRQSSFLSYIQLPSKYLVHKFRVGFTPACLHHLPNKESKERIFPTKVCLYFFRVLVQNLCYHIL